MSVVNDPNSPMYVPEENRKVARERAKQHVALIQDYLDVRDDIPTGFLSWARIQENKQRILNVLKGSEDDWKDYRWHLKHFIRDTETLGHIISLSDQEMQEIEKTANPLNRLFGKHIEKRSSKETKRHLKRGLPYLTENVTKLARIIYYVEEETVYILHCFKNHKEYERWYKSFK